MDPKVTLGLYAKFVKISPEEGTIDLQIKQKDPKEDYVVMKALVFPFINVLWLGIIVMFLGFLLSAYSRMRQKEKLLTSNYPFAK